MRALRRTIASRETRIHQLRHRGVAEISDGGARAGIVHCPLHAIRHGGLTTVIGGCANACIEVTVCLAESEERRDTQDGRGAEKQGHNQAGVAGSIGRAGRGVRRHVPESWTGEYPARPWSRTRRGWRGIPSGSDRQTVRASSTRSRAHPSSQGVIGEIGVGCQAWVWQAAQGGVGQPRATPSLVRYVIMEPRRGARGPSDWGDSRRSGGRAALDTMGHPGYCKPVSNG